MTVVTGKRGETHSQTLQTAPLLATTIQLGQQVLMVIMILILYPIE